MGFEGFYDVFERSAGATRINVGAIDRAVPWQFRR
jgi:hypothetical protein